MTASIPLFDGITWLDPRGRTWTNNGSTTLVMSSLGVQLFASQINDTTAQISWGMVVETVNLWEETSEALVLIGTFPSGVITVDVPFIGVAGNTFTYILHGIVSDTAEHAHMVVRNMTGPYTYGAVPIPTALARYTNLEAVKKSLNITDTSFDTEIVEAIVAAEGQIDQQNGRSFPDSGATPEYAYVPLAVSVWALSAAIGTFKLRDTVYGSAGSDDWLGAVDVGEQVRRALQRNPMAKGFRVRWGMA